MTWGMAVMAVMAVGLALVLVMQNNQFKNEKKFRRPILLKVPFKEN